LLFRELMREGSCPAAVTQRMDFHPDSVLPFAQLQRARTARDPKVPMMAAATPSQLALASNHETTLQALGENLPGGEVEVELQHGWQLIVDPHWA
jgi:hypothetical protein